MDKEKKEKKKEEKEKGRTTQKESIKEENADKSYTNVNHTKARN